MTKNGITLTVVAVVLAAIYIYAFTDLFHKDTIQIIATVRPGRAAAAPKNSDAPRVYPVSFTFNGKYDLTSVKVVAAQDLATNKHPLALWHLISESNSVPTKGFVYGYPIKGMKAAVARMRPEPLLPEVEYVLMLEAGKVHSQTNFRTVAVEAAQ